MSQRKNIVITGFMGTGKTAAGFQVSVQMRMEFFDTDHIIENQSGLTISEIFAKFGESHFRKLERTVIEDLAGREHIVIATGGGTLLDKHNRNLLSRNGLIVCLLSRPEVIADRLAQYNDRPLLANRKTIWDIIKLLGLREKEYHGLPNHIDTSDKTSAEVVREVIMLYRKETEYSSGGTA